MAKEIFFDDFLISVVKNFFGRQSGEFFHTGVKFRFGPFIEQVAPILGAFVLKEVVHHFADIVRVHAAIRDGGVAERPCRFQYIFHRKQHIPLNITQRNIFQFISDCEHGLKLLKIRIAGRKFLRRSGKAMDFHFQFFF